MSDDCLDCDTKLVQCLCHEGCPGGMCPACLHRDFKQVIAERDQLAGELADCESARDTFHRAWAEDCDKLQLQLTAARAELRRKDLMCTDKGRWARRWKKLAKRYWDRYHDIFDETPRLRAEVERLKANDAAKDETFREVYSAYVRTGERLTSLRAAEAEVERLTAVAYGNHGLGLEHDYDTMRALVGELVNELEPRTWKTERCVELIARAKAAIG